jgi:hypothetical protein
VAQGMKEVWKTIKNYPGNFQVSNKGRVKNNKGKIVKPNFNNAGFMRVSLYYNNQFESALVHRLVAECFIDNPKGYKYTRVTGDKTNINVNNVEWIRTNGKKYNKSYDQNKGGRPKTINRVTKKSVMKKCYELGRDLEKYSYLWEKSLDKK